MKYLFKNIGTRSVLYGAHCFFIHPWFVALAWIKLYGFPFDPRLWIAFLVHDLGYIGKPNIDGHEGEQHPNWGAEFMGAFFGIKWYYFTLFHSRFLAKKHNAQYSKLCVADKLSFSLTPHWLYLPMVRLSGELTEFMEENKIGKYKLDGIDTSGERAWHKSVGQFMAKWAWDHKDLKPDVQTKVHTLPLASKAKYTPTMAEILNDMAEFDPDKMVHIYKDSSCGPTGIEVHISNPPILATPKP